MMVQEEVPEEKKKPPYSYASLIRLAIINSETQKVALPNFTFDKASSLIGIHKIRLKLDFVPKVSILNPCPISLEHSRVLDKICST